MKPLFLSMHKSFKNEVDPAISLVNLCTFNIELVFKSIEINLMVFGIYLPAILA